MYRPKDSDMNILRTHGLSVSNIDFVPYDVFCCFMGRTLLSRVVVKLIELILLTGLLNTGIVSVGELCTPASREVPP